MFARIAAFLVRFPVPVLVVEAAVTAVAVLFALQMQFDFAPQAMLRGDDGMVRELDEFKRTFAYEDAVLMLVLEALDETDVLDQHALTWQAQVALALDSRAEIDRVESVAGVQSIRRTLRLPPDLISTPVITELPVDEETAERVRRIADKSELLEGSLLSADRRTAAVLAFVSPRVASLDDMRSLVDDVRLLLAAQPAPEGYRARLTGLPYLRVDTVDNLRADQRRLLPFAAFLYLAMLGLTFRRLSGSLLPLLAVGIGLTWTVGLVVALGETFNLISNVLPILMLVIGVSNCVHIVADYGEQSVRTAGDRAEAVRRTIRHMGLACLLSMLTTAVGFASLFTARSDVLIGFGWQAALGMACLYVSIIATLGALLRFFKPPRRSAAGAPLGGVVTAAADIVDDHPKTTLVLAALAVGLMIWMARGVRVNSSFIETYNVDHPTLRALKVVERELGGLLPIEISLRADGPGRFLEPDIYQRVADFERFARGHAPVRFVRSYVDFHETIGAEFAARSSSSAEETDPAEALAQRIKRSQWVINKLSDTLSMKLFLTEDGQRARVLIKVRDVGTSELQALINRLDAELTRLFPADVGIVPAITGDAYVNTVAMNNVIHDLFWSLLTASVVIFSIIAIGLRSLRAGLIAAVPNVTPLLFTLGYMGWRGYEMNVGNVIVFTISLGIAVDDTIHFLSRFREQINQRHDVLQAVHHTYEESGRAIVIVTLLVISGLSVLLFSDFTPTRHFAELTMITMATAIFGDLLILPACLVLFWKRKDFP